MRPRTLGMSKVDEAEARVGTTRRDFFRTNEHLSQGEMGELLGVHRVTVIRWMQELGLSIEQRRVIRRKRAA